ncbi:hypothetical protein [Cystobacter ferrugineus]|uniref:hypothetical protein n=1 Tax=Cystobacter ferrugineus TaxID=83449 RepID=UPI001160F028|nr:hypothetical protein [Cystobacter ferrugineus]
MFAASLLSACGTAPEQSDEPLGGPSPAASSVSRQAAALDTSACLSWANDPITGQKCPINTPCTTYADCGVQTPSPSGVGPGSPYWYCSTSNVCQFLPVSNGFSTATGTCTGQLQFRQNTAAPFDKKILPPDGVSFRQGTTLAFEVTNTTTSTLYLDQIPLSLEMAGTNPSRFDVSSIKMYQAGTRADSGDGTGLQLICVSPNSPFLSSVNFTLGTGATGGCGGSYFSRITAGGTARFLIDLTFAANQTYIANRQYRLKIGSLATGLKARTSTASTAAAYTGCTLPATGMTGAYLIFSNP